MAEIKSINNMPLCDKAAREDIEKITSEINTLVTKDELDEAIAEIDETILGIDVSTYATKDELDNKANTEHTHDEYLTTIPDEYITESELDGKGYLTEHQSLDDYALKADVPTKISELKNDADYTTYMDVYDFVMPQLANKAFKDHLHEQYLTEHQSLDGYATEQYVQDAILGIQAGDVDLSSYVTKDNMSEELNNYVTTDEIQYYATIDYVDESIENIELTPNLEGYATEQYVQDAIAEAQLGGEGGSVDLSDYASKDEVTMALASKSDVTHDHDDLYLRIGSLDGYATEQYVQNLIGDIDSILDAINGEVL